jgi:hypothetical protein
MRLFGSSGAAAFVVAILALGSGCGSASSTGASGTPAPDTHAPRAVAPVIHSGHSASIHFAEGRQSVAFTMRESGGVILLYRLSAPLGVPIRGATQLPSVTVPLLIGTTGTERTSYCHAGGARVTCTVGEQWCPMPGGTWHVRLRKLGGPAGNVTVWFHVGQPPSGQAE